MDFRATVSAALDDLASSDDFQALLADVLSLERLQWTRCPHCDEKVQVSTPDYRGYAAALSAFDGIGKGKQKAPEDTVVDDDAIRAAVMRVLEDLSDEEISRLARID